MVTCINAKSKQLVSYSFIIIPLMTQIAPKWTHIQAISQALNLSKITAHKYVTSTESSNFHLSENDEDKRRGNDSNC